MAHKAKSKQEEALQFLDDLDSLSPEPAPSTSHSVTASDSSSKPANAGEAAEVLAFLDEITQRSSEPTRITPSHIERPLSRASTPGPMRKSTERVKVGAPASLTASGSPTVKGLSPAASYSNIASSAKADAQPADAPVSSSGGWGWGTVWSTASTALQQAKSVVDEQVKHLPKQDQAKKWSEGMLEYARSAQLDKLGQDFRRVGLSTLTDILNAVAPPISEHEVIQVWLSHDMEGYEGVESLVYNALTRILEQVEGGDLIVNKGNESKMKDASDKPLKRDMHAVEGLDAALKLAQANVEDLIKNNRAPEKTTPSSAENPTTTSYVYLRIQPLVSSLILPEPMAIVSKNLQFAIHLVDPSHQLSHTTVTQSVPSKWLDVWDQYDWVEDLVAEVLRVGVEVVGQEYVVARMGWVKEDRVETSSDTVHVKDTQ
ncbi:maintenance of telomere capping protein 1 [Amylostereum chailletii]|nr:maintenance of telomere capping protein 1 [Amylostereum chailletii]